MKLYETLGGTDIGTLFVFFSIPRNRVNEDWPITTMVSYFGYINPSVAPNDRACVFFKFLAFYILQYFRIFIYVLIVHDYLTFMQIRMILYDIVCVWFNFIKFRLEHQYMAVRVQLSQNWAVNNICLCACIKVG